MNKQKTETNKQNPKVGNTRQTMSEVDFWFLQTHTHMHPHEHAPIDTYTLSPTHTKITEQIKNWEYKR